MISLSAKNSESVLLVEPHVAVMFFAEPWPIQRRYAAKPSKSLSPKPAVVASQKSGWPNLMGGGVHVRSRNFLACFLISRNTPGCSRCFETGSLKSPCADWFWQFSCTLPCSPATLHVSQEFPCALWLLKGQSGLKVKNSKKLSQIP